MQTEDQIFERIEARLKEDRRRGRFFLWYILLPVLTGVIGSLLLNWLRVPHPTAGSYCAGFMAGLTPAILLLPRCQVLVNRDDEAERTDGPSS